ncbi:hypothetical protein P43SY_010476 [Pythium insidiosum]|uniref:Uncharacterized protein n=1 Tax=Pythium insidiosum TaxID=114742 RepID=A0AAD5Q462_PYTIN|nr:hypothetical protein P43SY_010476 [Pythium insidiosum]
MLLPMQPLGTFLGSRYGPNNGFPESWQGNDGVVNKESMIKDATGQVVTFSGNSEVGKWNQMRELSRLDHLAVVGVTLHTQVKDVYVEHAKLLKSLPLVPSAHRRMTETADVTSAEERAATGLAAAIDRLTTAAEAVNSKADLERLCATPINSFAANYCAEMLKQQPETTTRQLRGTA